MISIIVEANEIYLLQKERMFKALEEESGAEGILKQTGQELVIAMGLLLDIVKITKELGEELYQGATLKELLQGQPESTRAHFLTTIDKALEELKDLDQQEER